MARENGRGLSGEAAPQLSAPGPTAEVRILRWLKHHSGPWSPRPLFGVSFLRRTIRLAAAPELRLVPACGVVSATDKAAIVIPGSVASSKNVGAWEFGWVCQCLGSRK
jgi:hypothetical protein